MAGWLKQNNKKGKYWKHCQYARKIISNMDFVGDKAKDEDHYGNQIIGALRAKNALKDYVFRRTNKNPPPRVPQFWGKKHLPDAAICFDKENLGTAIEVKLIKSHGAISLNNFRNAVGQCLFYRSVYRFVILVVIDGTKNSLIYKASKEKKERSFLKELEENYQVFTYIKPT